MRKAIGRTLGLALAGVALLATSATAQVEIKSGAAEIKITGRLQPMYDYSTSAEELSSIFLIRRARITLEIKINDWISGKIQPDYSTGFGLENGLRLKDAYIDFKFSEPFRIRMGQFKRPFDMFELTSSTQILVIERTGFVRGADECAVVQDTVEVPGGGIGSVCTYSRMTEKLGYADRDVGFEIGGVIAGHWAWSASMTNGAIFEDIVTFSGDSLVFSDGKSFGGRLEYRGDDLKIGGNVAAHDYSNAVKEDVVEY
ncbi:MAG TPA: porin, partial [Gemmatimonadota bacterium]|nr:porin [Gemmatimonadota bacterium]